jgi:hypothetical protein
MRTSTVVLCCLVGVAAVVRAEEFKVDWIAGENLLPLEVTVGDTVTFTYTKGSHDVVQVEEFGCDAANINAGTTLGGFETSSYTFKATEPGVVIFTCSVPGHCESGQILDVIVQTVRGGGDEGGADADGDGTSDISTLDQEIPEDYLDDPEFADILANGIPAQAPSADAPTEAPEEELSAEEPSAESADDVEAEAPAVAVPTQVSPAPVASSALRAVGSTAVS